jgi:hypothetical protein
MPTTTPVSAETKRNPSARMCGEVNAIIVAIARFTIPIRPRL